MNRRTGTSQLQRAQETMLMNTFQMDNRSFDDLLFYIQRILGNLLYYNEQNIPDGNWSQVISGSSIFYMIGIVNEKTESLLNAHQSVEEAKKVVEYWRNTTNGWPLKLLELDEPMMANKISTVLYDEVFNAQLRAYESDQLINIYNLRKTYGKENAMLFALNPDQAISDENDAFGMLHVYLKFVLYIQKLTKEYIKDIITKNNSHRPDVALFMAFAELFKSAQNNLNSLPLRHLDFYFKDILRQEVLPGVQTSAIVSFQLLPKIQKSLINQGALVSAGKLVFNTKKDLLFETKRSLTILSTTLERINTLYINKNPNITAGTKDTLVSDIKLVSLMNSSDGLKTTDGNDAALFGADPNVIYNPQIQENCVGDMGFILGSPVLFLSEGIRQIKVTFYMLTPVKNSNFWNLIQQVADNPPQKKYDYVFHNLFDNAFNISYTTIGGWINISDYWIDYDHKNNAFSVTINLSAAAPAMDAFSDSMEIKWPSLKFELNPMASIYVYSFFTDVQLYKIVIDADVNDAKNVSAYNNLGKIITSKAFDLFGPIPEQFDYLMIGKAELFKKRINKLSVNLNWNSVPQDYGGFDVYYKGYSEVFTNSSFQIKPTILINGNWVSEISDLESLFVTYPCIAPDGSDSVKVSPESMIEVTPFEVMEIPRDYTLMDPIPYSTKTLTGFIKLMLVAPTQAFGASEYSSDIARIARYNAINRSNLPYPNKPFVPKVSSLSLNYSASDELIFDPTFSGDTHATFNSGEFKHITPLGLKNVLVNKIISGNDFIYNFNSSGYLILAFSQVQFPSVLSVYFQLSGNKKYFPTAENNICWEYLQYEDWILLDPKNILSDGTDKFVRSGIIEIVLPFNILDVEDANRLYYIRISPKSNPQNFPFITGIFLNATEVVCTTEDKLLIGRSVPAGSINVMNGNYPDIKSVIQPADSKGGRVEEDFIYTRVRERLRHKSRAVTLWDYERLVLQNFPEVGIAKCTNLDINLRPQSKYINVIVLRNDWDYYKQKYFNIDELSAIQKFLQDSANTFSKIRVMNPVIETLFVNCSVVFDPEDTGGYYLKLLNKEIINFLSPISNLGELNGQIGKSVMPQMLASYLENLPYVKTIDNLYIEHIVETGDDKFEMEVFKGGDIINVNTDCSILLPFERSGIYINALPFKFDNIVGIGNMEIGLDFIIGSPTNCQTEATQISNSSNLSEQAEDIINTVLFIKENVYNYE